jgi:FkbH-like protein
MVTRAPTASEDREIALHGAAERLEWQPILFAPTPERRALLRLRASWPLADRHIRVHRNHTVEPSMALVRPYLEYAGIAPRVMIGDYDDSLSFSEVSDEPADAEIVWLDHERFALSGTGLADWLATRLTALRARTSAPILVLDSDGPPEEREPFVARLSEAASEIGGVRIADRTELWRELGEGYFDPERVTATGTRMSREGGMQTARLLGTRWLPVLLAPRLKAIVVDLDNTLYSGVLGEDGPDRLDVTDGHRALGRELRALRDSGVFLAIASRNEAADVNELFARRDDLPLSLDDLSATAIGWQPKSESLREIADKLRIGTDALLFVDDNPGELLDTMHQLPELHCLAADPAGEDTARALALYPGLFSFGGAAADAVRLADLRANEARTRVRQDSVRDIAAYYRELQVSLTVARDRRSDLERAASLSNKTNQFNLAFARYTEGALMSLFAFGDWRVSTIALRDRLSDSGIIAMAVTERAERTLRVHELCVSCRALGRRLEDLIVGHLLGGPSGLTDVDDVIFTFVDGPRNQPARAWLAGLSASELPAAEEPMAVAVTAAHMRDLSMNNDVAIEEAS